MAALVAALGASMTSMAGNLSRGEKYVSIAGEISSVLQTMNELIAENEQLFLRDMASFDRYMQALKLPNGNEEQKNSRKQAVLKATIAAIVVPMQLMEACKCGLECSLRIAEGANGHVISDLGIGAVLFEAAAQSALLTVDINLASLKDAEVKQQYAVRAASLICDITSLRDQTLGIVRRRIG